jgi:two-component system, chemotaxis family, protein-glutamate methylesterase/glutaminase
MKDKIKVLVVDDTRTTRQMLTQWINQTDDLTVIGEAADGEHGVAQVEKLRPDIVLMDIVMPKMDGLQATRAIMQTRPTPIVLITASHETYETDIAFKAIRAGALTVLPKPSIVARATEFDSLMGTLRMMSTVRVIRHYPQREITPRQSYEEVEPITHPEMIAIGASTGGPAALSEIIKHLPHNLMLPIVIVQHIAPDFVDSLIGFFQTLTPLPVETARDGEQICGGRIYIAPGNHHLSINERRTFELDPRQNGHLHMPSINVLFHSVAQRYGAHAVGVLLTGMGADGAQGIRAMYEAGAFTIAQDESTSVVFGMPKEAIRLGVARKVLPIEKIANTITELIR